MPRPLMRAFAIAPVALNGPWVRLPIGFDERTGASRDVALRPCSKLLADTRAELF